MATMTGENLLNSIIESTGVEINTLIFNTLSARLQQMIDNGTYSKLAAAVSMSGFSTVINGATEIGELSDAVETNADLIAAAAEGEVDAIVFPPIGDGAGNTINLTTGDDVVGPDVETEGFITTELNDTINGTVSALGAENTFNATDVIDGGAGDDVANIEMNTAFAGFGTGSMTNVETVNLTNDGTTARTFAAKGVTGVDQYNLTGAVNLSNLDSADTVIVANNRTANLTVAYATDVLKGTTDNLALTLNNVGTADDPGTAVDEEVASLVTVAGFESAALTAEGVNVVELAGLDAAAITVDGTGSLKVNDVNAALKTFDASENTGGVQVDLTAGATLTSFKSGAGDDTLTANASAELTANAVIDGGKGADTLSLGNTGATTVQYQMTGVETIGLEGLAGKLTFSAAESTGIEAVSATGDIGADADFVGLGAVDMAYNLMEGFLGGGGPWANTISADNSGASTITLTPSSAATAADPEINDTALTLSKTSSVALNVAEFGEYDGVITAAEATSLTANIVGEVTNTNANSFVLGSATDLNITTTNSKIDQAFGINAANAERLTLSAAAGVDLTGGAALAGLQTLNVATEGLFEIGNLAAINSVNITGEGSADLGNLGGIDLVDYGISVTAMDLASEEIAGPLSLDIGAVNTEGQAINLNVSDVAGGVNIGAINANNGATVIGNVSLLATNTKGDVTLSTIAGNTVLVDASNMDGELTLGGAITGKAVTIDTSSTTLDTVTYAAIDAGSSLTLVGAELLANDWTTGAITATGASLNADVTGGIGVDQITIAVTAGTTTSVTLVGDLGLGANVAAINAAAHDKAITINASGFDAGIDGTMDITGGNLGDTITGTAGADTITGGTGADKLTGGAGADTFVVAAQTTAAGIDWITDFVGGTDILKTGITPTTAALTDLTANDFSGSTDLADAAADAVAAAIALDAANYDSAGDAVTFTFGAKTYISVNDAANATFIDGTDVLVEITGITGTLAITDIIV